eukprot:CAMPEP_0113642552 /NCGR_PEP_ID=MMETSP0017_2-20120614/22359_1 /TAXON_ID=2856 /ORGANISM="Cylindrotheca closterium" /LENGTH=314 /DNA_ID=CAMNT_0000553991 /DNA_START=288 /DNA_END=1230 /DNA_ORIENTATION=- /assembly_acc=CAM_ASM_000147
MIRQAAFNSCKVLVEVSLSTTSIMEISSSGFIHCRCLQTVSLPNSLERIRDDAFYECMHLVTVIVTLDSQSIESDDAFYECMHLVTVIVALDSQSIEIEENAFGRCWALANLVLPKGSNAMEDTFDGCVLLQGRFGEGGAGTIVTGLTSRFDDFPVHKMCYYHSSTTAQELRLCIENREEVEESLVDEFEMTPFHVLFSTAKPRGELLEVLLDKFPYYVLGWKDANDKLAMDYLVTNWTRNNKILLQMALQNWMLSPLMSWGATSWMEVMGNRVQGILAEDDKARRSTLWNGAYSAFARYEQMELTSILEMALW